MPDQLWVGQALSLRDKKTFLVLPWSPSHHLPLFPSDNGGMLFGLHGKKLEAS